MRLSDGAEERGEERVRGEDLYNIMGRYNILKVKKNGI